MDLPNPTPVWSDFAVSGSTLDDYVNGAEDQPKSISQLALGESWSNGANFGADCVQMKPSDDFKLTPTGCDAGEAKSICMKNACPIGFTWLNMKKCVKIMDSSASKEDALSACKVVHPRATLLTPKSHLEQKEMEKFFLSAQLEDDIFLGAKKSEDGQWFWDDGSPLFVESKFTF